MHPRIREGEVIMASPEAGLCPGEEVVIGLKDGKLMVKELVSRRDDGITVDAAGAHRKRAVIAIEDTDHVHAVIGIHPASAIKRR